MLFVTVYRDRNGSTIRERVSLDKFDQGPLLLRDDEGVWQLDCQQSGQELRAEVKRSGPSSAIGIGLGVTCEDEPNGYLLWPGVAYDGNQHTVIEGENAEAFVEASTDTGLCMTPAPRMMPNDQGQLVINHPLNYGAWPLVALMGLSQGGP